MVKKIRTVLFVIGIVMILIGTPYLLGYSTNEILRYSLYLGLLVTIVFALPIKLAKRN